MGGDRRARAADARGVGAAAAVAAALGVMVAVQPRDAPPSRAAVVAVVGLVVATTLVAGRRRQRRTSSAWIAAAASRVAHPGRTSRAGGAGVAIWVALVAAFVAWDAYSFAEQRPDFPTLSHYLGLVTAPGWGRGLLAAAWVGWGGWTALGWRARR